MRAQRFVRLVNDDGKIDKFIYYDHRSLKTTRSIIKFNTGISIHRSKAQALFRWITQKVQRTQNCAQALADLLAQHDMPTVLHHHYVPYDVGIDFNIHGTGHIEIKFQHVRTHDKVVLNVHVEKDKRNRTLSFYIQRLKKILSDFCQYDTERLLSLERMNPTNFRSFNYRVARFSARLFRNLEDRTIDIYGNQSGFIDGNAYNARQRAFNDYVMTEAAWHGDDHYDASLYINGDTISLFSRRVCSDDVAFNLNYTRIVFSYLTSIFDPTRIDVEVDAYDGGGPGSYTEEEPMEVEDVIFRGCDFGKLDLSNPRFFRCDFTAADLRLATLDFNNMDTATQQTLWNAHLSPQDRALLVSGKTHKRKELQVINLR